MPNPGDPLPVEADAIHAKEAVRVFNDLASKLDARNQAIAAELEPYLHKLPQIQFNSIEERQEFEQSLAGLLARLDRRVVRYDPNKQEPLEDPPSLLRCDSLRDGYFRLESRSEGDKVRINLGTELPALSLATPLPDERRRRK